MRIKTLNGYDVTLHIGKCTVKKNRFFFNISIHREEHITETFLGDLSRKEIIELMNDLEAVLST